MELAVGPTGKFLQVGAVDAEAQPNGVDRHTLGQRPTQRRATFTAAAPAEFSAIAEDDDGATGFRRAGRCLDGQHASIIERRLAAKAQGVDGIDQHSLISGVILDQAFIGVEGDNSDRIVRANGIHKADGSFFGAFNGHSGHTAAGIDCQHDRERQAVFSNVLDLHNAGAIHQFSKNREVFLCQPQDRLPHAIIDIGIDHDGWQIGGVDAGDFHSQRRLQILQHRQPDWNQQNKRNNEPENPFQG